MCVPVGIDITEETKECDDGFAIVEGMKLWTLATRQGLVEIRKSRHGLPATSIRSITSILLATILGLR